MHACDRSVHTRFRRRRAGVDGLDARVRVRAEQDGHVQHAWQREVVDVVALAVEEAPVLLALDRLADSAVHMRGRAHWPPPAATAWGAGALAAACLMAAACLIALTMFM